MAQSLNLADPASYRESIEWIRNNVVFKKQVEGPVLELNVSVIGANAALFMNPVGHYILGFRGADRIYILKDSHSESFKESIDTTYKLSGKNASVILRGLGAHHGSHNKGLATVGQDSHTFHKSDFKDVAELSTFVQGKKNLEILRKPLSLLVYMIAEGARFPMIENELDQIYRGGHVKGDDAVQSYHDAGEIQKIANRCFPQELNANAVERLNKRAIEFREILDYYANRYPDKNDADIIARLSSGKDFPNLPPGQGYKDRFLMMCKQLNITGKEVNSIVASCTNEAAVRAAAAGVIAPGIYHVRNG